MNGFNAAISNATTKQNYEIIKTILKIEVDSTWRSTNFSVSQKIGLLIQEILKGLSNTHHMSQFEGVINQVLLSNVGDWRYNQRFWNVIERKDRYGLQISCHETTGGNKLYFLMKQISNFVSQMVTNTIDMTWEKH